MGNLAAARCSSAPRLLLSAGAVAPVARLHLSALRCEEGDARPDCKECTASATRVFCGGEHTLLRDPNTLEVYQIGACGLGFDHNDAAVAADPRNYARHVPLPGPATAVFAGRYHNFARLIGGRCFAYGCGRQAPNDGQLLTGSEDEATEPVATSIRFAHAALGGHHSLVRKRTGEVWACGAGWQAQMGNGGLQYKNPTPVQVAGLPRIERVASGYYHGAAFAEDGSCYVWGCNEQGQLGSTADDHVKSPRLLSELVPELAANNSRVADFAGGYGHTVLLLKDGSVLTLGNEGEGQRALNPNDEPTPIVSEVSGLPGPASAVAAGNHHTLVLIAGAVWAFGSDEFGQVTGLPDPLDESELVWRPRQVGGLPADDPVLRIDAGMYHSAAQTVSGRVFLWGCGGNGQTGEESLPSRTTVKEVDLTDIARRCSSRSAE